MANPKTRRAILHAGLIAGSTATAGCLTEDTASIPLRFERVLNFTDATLQVALTIRSSNDGEQYRYTQAVEPISTGPSAEWVVTPENVDDAFEYTSELEINAAENYTADHRRWEDGYDSANSEDSCLTVSWFVRDPASDVAPIGEVTTNCDVVEQNGSVARK
jgi:hypothetical protein